MTDRTQQSRSGRWAAYLLGGFAVLAPQLLGGATPNMQLVIVSIGALVAALCAFTFRDSTGQFGFSPLAGIAALIAAAWTLVQALPLPCSWTSWAQPDRSAINVALIDLGVLRSPSCTLSLSPGSTWASLGLSATLAALLLSATLATRAGHRRLLLVSVATSSITMACVALAHAVADADSVFGLYLPLYARPQLLLAPLMNENHLAGHIALGFPLCIGFARTSDRYDGRILWSTAALITFATGLLTLSRAGAGVLLASGVVYLLLDFASRRSQINWRTTIATVAVAAASAVFGGYFALDLLTKQFTGDEAPMRKLDAALKLAGLIREHPWVGIGRGALGDVSALVIVRNQRQFFAECLPVQWILDWGIPISLLVTALFAASAARLRAPQRIEKALACGLGALVVQNFVDFSLELAGVACTAAIATGVLAGREKQQATASWTRWARIGPLSRVAALAALCCAATASIWLTFWSRSTLQSDLTHEIYGSMRSPVRASLAKALTSYPLDPMFVLLGAAAAVERNERTASRWLNLALDRAPGWAGPHLQAAVYLERNNRLDQAAIELGLAVALDASQHSLACNFLKRHPSAALAWTITPVGARNEQASRESMVDCLVQEQKWSEADEALQQLVERFPLSEYGRRRSVLVARNVGDSELAFTRAAAMYRTLPGSAAAIATFAEVLGSRNESHEALRIIDAAPSEVRQSQEVLLAEATCAARLGDEQRLEYALSRALARYGNTTRTRVGLLRFASEMFTITGNHVAALGRARSAFELSGDPDLLELAHQAALRAGLMSAALRTAAELCNVGYRGRAFCGDSRQLGVSP